MKIETLLQGIDDCDCGRKHSCPIEHVVIGKDILQSLQDICKEYQNPSLPFQLHR